MQVYEAQTYEAILKRMLNRVSADVDKREGSIIYDALAPAAAELAQTYMELDVITRLGFADTATGQYLDRRTAEFGITRTPASHARRKGYFYGANGALLDIPIGSRFGSGDKRYYAVERVSAGVFILECETAGATGNEYFGTLLPIDYMNGLVRAELGEVLVPGEDTETDEELRQRYYSAMAEKPFGGNVSDYEQKLGGIPGVGAVKVFPAWQGGGTVKATLIGSDFSPPSLMLINEVQTLIDPTVNSGNGIGLAPIGHQVTITGVNGATIDVAATVQLANGVTIGQVQSEIVSAISAYLLSLCKTWAQEAPLVVRVSQIEAKILTVSGVTDISGTKINGASANVVLEIEEIPLIGTVTLHV